MTGNKDKIYDYVVEFSNEAGMVYLNERDPQTNFYNEIRNYDVPVSAEDFAYGLYESLLAAGYEADFENLDNIYEDYEEFFSDEDTDLD